MAQASPPSHATANGSHAHLHALGLADGQAAHHEGHVPQVLVQRIDTAEGRRKELVKGLLDEQAHINPKFFYDAQGCALYEALCNLVEYYPPRTEAAVFDKHQRDIAAALPRQAQFIDLGCGDGAKAWRWIEALDVQRYIGVDIAEEWLRNTLQRGARRFPHVAFDGVVTDFTRGLAMQEVLQDDAPRIFFYPGSSIGNFEPQAALRLLRQMCDHLQPGDRLLIGADAPKARQPLVAAYDDALGVTAAFNRNVLRVVNRELDANFDIGDFAHRALFNEQRSRIEMHLVAQRDVEVRLGAHGSRRFKAGEAIVTEYSYKHSAPAFLQLLADAGFGDVRHWSDEQGWYGVYVAAPGAYRQ